MYRSKHRIPSRPLERAAPPRGDPRLDRLRRRSRSPIGSAVGTQNIADEDLGNGDSRTAERILADAGFPDDASEQVLIQSPAAT